MSPLITEETVFLFRSLVWGMALGAVYDMASRIGNYVFRGAWWRGTADLLYWTICAVVLFTMIREENGGTIRWYVLAAAASGAGIYYGGIRPVIHRLLRPLWILARKPIQFVENLLKKRKKSVTLIDKADNSTTSMERGSGHGRIR